MFEKIIENIKIQVEEFLSNNALIALAVLVILFVMKSMKISDQKLTEKISKKVEKGK